MCCRFSFGARAAGEASDGRCSRCAAFLPCWVGVWRHALTELSARQVYLSTWTRRLHQSLCQYQQVRRDSPLRSAVPCWALHWRKLENGLKSSIEKSPLGAGFVGMPVAFTSWAAGPMDLRLHPPLRHRSRADMIEGVWAVGRQACSGLNQQPTEPLTLSQIDPRVVRGSLLKLKMLAQLIVLTKFAIGGFRGGRIGCAHVSRSKPMPQQTVHQSQDIRVCCRSRGVEVGHASPLCLRSIRARYR